MIDRSQELTTLCYCTNIIKIGQVEARFRNRATMAKNAILLKKRIYISVVGNIKRITNYWLRVRSGSRLSGSGSRLSDSGSRSGSRSGEFLSCDLHLRVRIDLDLLQLLEFL